MEEETTDWIDTALIRACHAGHASIVKLFYWTVVQGYIPSISLVRVPFIMLVFMDMILLWSSFWLEGPIPTLVMTTSRLHFIVLVTKVIVNVFGNSCVMVRAKCCIHQ